VDRQHCIWNAGFRFERRRAIREVDTQFNLNSSLQLKGAYPKYG
jgi:hypothetical protein